MEPAQGRLRPAPPDSSTVGVLIDRLGTTLCAQFQDAFAGMIRAPDGAIEVYSNGDPALADAVTTIRASSDGTVAVRLVPGMKNSLASLERLQTRVTA